MNNSTNSSNPVLGTVGAVIGSLLGVALWVGIYQLGYIAAIAGYVIIVGAFKGYEILSSYLDLKGIIISVVVAIFMVFAANYISWATDLLSIEYSTSLIQALKELPEVIVEYDLKGDFIKDLLIGYLLAIVGAASAVKGKLKNAI